MEQQAAPANAPAFGRKIFFLNPSFSVRSHIVDTLKILEYEVYTISDYRRAKSYLRIHKEAMLYINTEAQMNLASWINFIKSIKEDATFSSTIVGVLNEHLNPIELKALNDCPYITGGVFHVEGQFKGILPNVTATMDNLGAKGRRQYVRTICVNDKTAGFLWIQDGRMFKAQIVDISTASVAVMLTQKDLPFVQGRGEIFCTIQLGQKQIQTRAKPLVIKPSGQNFAAIFMLDDQTPTEAVAVVREYVFSTLELAMLKSVEGIAIDKTNYSVSMEDPRKNVFI